MASGDYYEILGISRDASDADIKSAYKKAARKYHPDNSDTGDEELFKKVGEAYEVLKDPQKRAIYDQYGEQGLKGAGGFGGGAGGFQDFGGFAGGDFEDLGDIFSSFFGGGFASSGSRRRSTNGPRRGQDQQVSIKLDFLDPLQDTNKKIRMNPLADCKTCDGKGAEKSEDVIVCSSCNGQGEVVSVQNTILGQIRHAQTCPNCKGSGKSIKNPCKECNGRGRSRYEKEVDVKIPAGVEDGTRLKLNGMGDAGIKGGPAGDLYLLINVAEHPKFQREGANIYSEEEVDFATAALGDQIEVDTVNGKQKIKIKNGTQAGHVEILRNKGMPFLGRPNRYGDHYIKIHVKTPEKLSSEEKKLLKELKKIYDKKSFA